MAAVNDYIVVIREILLAQCFTIILHYYYNITSTRNSLLICTYDHNIIILNCCVQIVRLHTLARKYTIYIVNPRHQYLIQYLLHQYIIH